MTKHAQIMVTRTTGPFDAVTHAFEWQGPIDAPVFVMSQLIDEVPFPLHKIEDQPWKAGGLYVRTDARFWRVTAARYALRRGWEWFTVRAVLTLYVWGCAERAEGRRPAWRDVRWPRG